MVSQAQRRALAGQTKPNLVPSYVLTLNARRSCLGRAKSLGKEVGSEGHMGQPEGSRLRREALAMPVLERLVCVGGSGEAGGPLVFLQTTSPWVCCCQSPAEVCPAQAILAGTVCLANLMSP